MDDFSRWFDENSGYALHAVQTKPLAGCCAGAAIADGRRMVWLHAVAGREAAYPLYQCARCGKHYAKRKDGFVYLENLLRFRVTAE